jgi:hypothetical protein
VEPGNYLEDLTKRPTVFERRLVLSEPFGLPTVDSGRLRGDVRMDKNTGFYAMMVAVAFAVVALFVIGLVDRARDTGTNQEVTQHTLDE